jgi:hypothetical protein
MEKMKLHSHTLGIKFPHTQKMKTLYTLNQIPIVCDHLNIMYMVDTTLFALMEASCNSFNQELSFHCLYFLFAWVVYLPSITSKNTRILLPKFIKPWWVHTKEQVSMNNYQFQQLLSHDGAQSHFHLSSFIETWHLKPSPN